MKLFFLFLLLSCLHHVFCNSEEVIWRDWEEIEIVKKDRGIVIGEDSEDMEEIETVKNNREEGIGEDPEHMEEIEMETNDIEQSLRSSKALSSKDGCMVTDDPLLKNYTCDARIRCFIPHQAPGRMSYRGRLNTTISGKTCKVWNTIDPQSAYRQYTRFGGHNFCRGSLPTPNFVFCLTTDPNVVYEECDVPKCLALTKGKG